MIFSEDLTNKTLPKIKRINKSIIQEMMSMIKY